MKKKLVTLASAFACTAMLCSCGQDIAKEAAQKGKSYFDSGDYETASKAFGLAIDNGSSDEEIKNLYDITLKYYQANKEYGKNNYETAEKIIESIDANYENYGIKDKIVTLKSDILKAVETEKNLKDVSDKLSAGDYAGAETAADKISVSDLSQAQVEELNGYKTNISSQKAAEQERIEKEKQAAEEAKKQAEQKAKDTTAQKNTQSTAKANTKTNTQKNTSTAQKPQTQAAAPAAAPAINTNVSADAYIYPSDTTLLTREQLATLSKNDIALIRNEIYARKGHIFTTSKYQSYFAAKTWYTPQKTIYWQDLNDTEKANIKLIKEFEGK